MTPEQGERAHEIWEKVYSEFNRVLSDNLRCEPQEIKDYVEEKILNDYRPWNYDK